MKLNKNELELLINGLALLKRNTEGRCNNKDDDLKTLYQKMYNEVGDLETKLLLELDRVDGVVYLIKLTDYENMYLGYNRGNDAKLFDRATIAAAVPKDAAHVWMHKNYAEKCIESLKRMNVNAELVKSKENI